MKDEIAYEKGMAYTGKTGNSYALRLEEPGTPPVYFRVVADSAALLSGPQSDSLKISALEYGQIVMVLEEKFDSEAYYVRVMPVKPEGNKYCYYYYYTEPGEEELWLCASRDGSVFAEWSDIDADALEAEETDMVEVIGENLDV